MMTTQYDDQEDDIVVDYKEWTRTLRLADWRVFALLMVLIAILAGSFLPFWGGVSLFHLLIRKIFSIYFLVAVAFYVLWGAVLYQTISGYGFQRVRTNAFGFLGYIAGAYLILTLASMLEMLLKEHYSFESAWENIVRLSGGIGFFLMIIASLVLLFMGMCFNAQMEVAMQMKRVERK